MKTFEISAVVVSAAVERSARSALTTYVEAALIAGIESQLLGTVTSAIGDDDGISAQALLAFTYMALFLPIGATMEALVLTQELGSMAVRSSRDQGLVLDEVKVYDGPIGSLLSRFNGKRQSWRLVLGHCTCLRCSYDPVPAHHQPDSPGDHRRRLLFDHGPVGVVRLARTT